ncbi:hypothetical protein HGRIS_009548 [Hohenbuehelia grisea]|uniref:DUF7704 domain-containing protein n=1 Tax=Hohenbuehelia grisea TaxID=104357 RepID=A0ABR3J1M7_9AGAR
MMSPPSAIPDVYYAIFGVYEPFLTVLGFIGALFDPKTTHDSQAPWPQGIAPSDPLPRATLVTIIQLGHVCGLVGVVNAFLLTAARRHLATQVILQEKIVRALLTPLLIGDFLHLYVTLWALGDQKWDFRKYVGIWELAGMSIAAMAG